MNMTLQQATDLAATIHADPLFLVIAIGRFRLVTELTTGNADAHPWGVSVVPRDNSRPIATLWNPEQWAEYRAIALEDLRPRQAAAAAPSVQPASATEDQLLLF